MEVRSETEVMASREPFTVAMQKPTAHAPPSMQNMRLTFTPGGTAVYKPITSTISPPPQPPNYQGGGGDGGNDTGGVIRAGNVAILAIPPPHGFNINMSEAIRKKKGRPRKYGSDGTMALALTPVSPPSVDSTSIGAGAFSPSSAPVIPAPVSGSGDAMKKRGRPPGSGTGRKLQLAALGLTGSGFTPHVIAVKTGEDVLAKIMSFSQNGHRAVCILSANGAISNVTLRQAAISGGTVTYEGRFEILSLSGSFLMTENGGQRSRTGGLSVSLADPDGRVLGGGVTGLLTAASPVQVVVGSFIAEGKKEPKHNFPLDTSSAPGKVASWEPMPMTGGNSPPSRGTLSESSGGPGSLMNQSTGRTSNNNGIHPGMLNMPWK